MGGCGVRRVGWGWQVGANRPLPAEFMWVRHFLLVLVPLRSPPCRQDAIPLLGPAFGGHWLVLGSLSPWIEAILLEYKAREKRLVFCLMQVFAASVPESGPFISISPELMLAIVLVSAFFVLWLPPVRWPPVCPRWSIRTCQPARTGIQRLPPCCRRTSTEPISVKSALTVLLLGRS